MSLKDPHKDPRKESFGGGAIELPDDLRNKVRMLLHRLLISFVD